MAEQRRVAVHSGARPIDVMVEGDLSVHMNLDAMGLPVDGVRTVVLDSAGRRIDLAAPFGVIADGEVLTVIDLTTPAVPANSADPAAGAVASTQPGRQRRPGRRSRHFGWLWAALAAAATVGVGASWTLMTEDPSHPASQPVRLLAIFAIATGLTWITHSLAPPGRFRAATGPVLVALVATTVLWAGTTMLGLPATAPAAVLAGATPICLRLLPGWCLDVPVEQLVDMEANATNRWTVRARPSRPAQPPRPATITRVVDQATTSLCSGLIVIAVLAVVGTGVVLLGPDQASGAHASWQAMRNIGHWVFLPCLIAALALRPRALQYPRLRVIPRLAAGILLIMAALWAARPAPAGTTNMAGQLDPLLVAVVCLGWAVLGFGAALATRRGVRAVGLSRIGDIVEALSTVLALPAALLAGNLVELVRGLLV